MRGHGTARGPERGIGLLLHMAASMGVHRHIRGMYGTTALGQAAEMPGSGHAWRRTPRQERCRVERNLKRETRRLRPGWSQSQGWAQQGVQGAETKSGTAAAAARSPTTWHSRWGVFSQRECQCHQTDKGRHHDTQRGPAVSSSPRILPPPLYDGPARARREWPARARHCNAPRPGGAVVRRQPGGAQ